MPVHWPNHYFKPRLLVSVVLFFFLVATSLCSVLWISYEVPEIKFELMRLAQAILAEKTGILVQLDDVGVEIYPPRLTLHHVKVSRLGRPLLFSSERIRILPGIVQNLNAKLSINWIEIENPRIQLTFYQQQLLEWHQPHTRTNSPSKPPETQRLEDVLAALPVELNGVFINRAQLDVHVIDQHTHLHINALSLHAHPEAALRNRIKIISTPIHLAYKNKSFTFYETALDAHMKSGHLLYPKQLYIESFKTRWLSSSLFLKGEVFPLSGLLNVRMHANTDLAELATYWPALAPSQGRIALMATFNNQQNTWPFTFNLNSEPLLIKGKNTGAIDVAVSGNRHVASLDEASLHLGNGLAQIKGRIHNYHTLAGDYDVRWKNVELGQLLHDLGIKDPYVVLPSDGQAHLSGMLRKKEPNEALLSGHVHVDAKYLESRDRSFRLGQPHLMLYVKPTSIDADVHFFPDRLELLHGLLINDAGQMHCLARFYFDAHKGLDIEGQSKDLNLSSFKRIAEKVDISGFADLDFQIYGPYGPPRIVGDLLLKHGRVAGISLGDQMLSQFDYYQAFFLKFSKAEAHYGSSLVHAEAELDFKDTPSIALSGHTHRANVSDLSDFHAYLPKYLSQSLQGILTGQINIAGALSAPDIEADFKGENVSINVPVIKEKSLKQNLGQLEGTLRLKQWQLDALNIKGALGHGRYQIDINGHDAQGQLIHTLDIAASFEHINSLDLAASASIHKDIKGIVSGFINGSLAPELVLNIDVKTDKAQYRTHILPNFNLQVVVEPDFLRGKFYGFDDKLKIEAGIHYGQEDNLQLQARLKPLNIQEWVEKESLQLLTLGGTLEMQGSYRRLAELSGKIDLDMIEMRTPGVRAVLKKPTRIRLKDQSLIFDALELVGPQFDTLLSGMIKQNGALNMNTHGHLEANTLGLVWPAIQKAEGALPFNIQILGNIDNIELSGQVPISDLNIQFDFLSTPIQHLNGQVSLSKNSIVFENMTGEIGSGHIDLEGDLHFKNNTYDNLSLYLDLEETPYQAFNQQIDVKLSGPLNIKGQAGTPIDLSGNLQIDELRYQKELNFDTLLPSLRKGPSYMPNADYTKPDVTFNLGLKTNESIVIDNNIAKATLGADIRIVGDDRRQGILGHLYPKEARIFFKNNTYEFVSGSIEFIDKLRILPRFDVRLTTGACNSDLWLNLVGTFETDQSYQLTAGGRDNNGVVSFEDARNCILLGYRGSQSANIAGINSTNAGILGGSGLIGIEALATISGIDQKIKKLLSLPLDYYLRFGSGYSQRLRSITPRLTTGVSLGKYGRLQLDSALIPNGDQIIEFELQLLDWATTNLYYSNSTEVNANFGIDLLKFRREY